MKLLSRMIRYSDRWICGEFHFQKRSHSGLFGPQVFGGFSGFIPRLGSYCMTQPEKNMIFLKMEMIHFFTYFKHTAVVEYTNST